MGGHDHAGSLNIQWQVLYIRERRVVKHNVSTDFAKAIRLYDLARDKGYGAVTLRSRNMAFPPPEELRPRYVRGRSKTTGQIIEGEVVPLDSLNRRGVWWCPYCVKQRKFVKQPYYVYDGIKVNIPRMACPMCGAAHTDFWVRYFNPIAKRFEGNFTDPHRAEKRRARQRRRRQQEDED